MLYFAYGSNLNLSQMAVRCPKAEPLNAMWVFDYKLIFRGVADITHEEGAVVPVGVFNITKDCEKALDVYEGFPRLYTKVYFKIGKKEYMTYTMNSTSISPPWQGYYETILEGYHDFGLDAAFLKKAREHSTVNYHAPKIAV